MARVDGGAVIIDTDWPGLKLQIDTRNVNFKYEEDSSAYEIFAIDGQYFYNTVIYKSGEAPQNQATFDTWRADFETNYKNRITDFNSTQPFYLSNIDGYSVVLKNGAAPTANDGYGIALIGYDGSNYRMLKSDTSGRPILVGAGTAGTPSGGVITIQGDPLGSVLPISGSVSVTGTVTTTNVSVGLNGSAIPTSSTLFGGTDGTNLQPARFFDLDTGGGQQFILGVGLRKAAGGGSVEAGTSTDPLRTDPTGTTTQPVSGTVTANQGGAWTVAATQSGTWTVQPGNTANTTPWLTTINQGGNSVTVSAAGALKIDGSAVTQPVSGTVTANAGTGNFTVVQSTASNLRAQLASESSTGSAITSTALLIGGSDGINLRSIFLDSSGRQIIIGAAANGAAVAGNPVLIAGSDGTNARSIRTASDGTIRIDPTGTTTQPISGTVTANAGTGTFTVAGTVTANVGTTGGLALDTTLAKLTISQSTALGSNTQALVGGSVTTAAPTYTTGNINPLSLTTSGALRIDGSATTQPVSGTIAATQSGTWTVQPGNTANTTPWLSTISQGGNSATVTASNALKVDGSAVTQPVSGTVTANIGTSGSLALDATLTGGTQRTKITDGTNNAAVKAASTAAVATDPALVVAISPNNTVAVTGTVTANNASVSTTGTSPPASATYIGGSVTTAAPSYTTGQMNALSLTTSGLLRIDGSGTTQPVSGTVAATQSGTWTVQPGNTANTTPWLTTISQGGNAATVTGANALKIDGSAVTQPISGTVTANIGTTNGLALDTTLSAQSLVDNAAFTDGTSRVVPSGHIFDEVAGTALTENDAAASRIDSKRAQVIVIEDTTTRGQRLTITASNAMKVDGSAVTQPVSGTVTANAGTGNFTVIGTATDNTTNSTSKLPVMAALSNTSAPSWTNGNMVPLSVDTAGALRITGSISATNPSVSTNNAAIPTSSTQIGGSDGTNLQAARVFDADTGAGTQYVLGVGLRKSASGGSVDFGTSSDPIRIDPTGTTTQPVSGTVTANIGTSGSLALDATLTGGTQTTRITDGTNTATVKAASTAAVAADKALVVAISPNNSVAVTGTFFQATQPVSGTVTANIGTTNGLALDATLAKLTISQSTALGSNTQALVGGSVTTAAPTYTTGNINPLSLTTAGALRTDSSGTTQPVSGTVTANAGTGNFTVVQATAANLRTQTASESTTASATGTVANLVGGAVTTAAPTYTTGQMNPLSLTTTGALRIDGSAVTQPISGTVTANIGTSGSLALDASITAQSLVDNAAFTDGTTRIQPVGYIFDEVSGTALTENDAAAARIDSKRAQVQVIEDGTTRGTRATVKAASTAAVAGDTALVVAISPNNSIAVTMAASGYGGQVEGRAADSAVVVGNPVLVGGSDGTNVQTILTDSFGRIIVAPAGTSASTSGFSFGYITLTATGDVPVRATAITEQTTNAQRSIVSTSANDASAGTGARTVKITYYDQTGAGPSIETVTLNGTTPVNTVSTTICYVEKIEVMTVGSTGSNVGVINLKAATAGGGATVMFISATSNQVFLGLHYVPLGKTCYITGLSAGSDSTAIGQGGLYSIHAQTLNSAIAPNKVVSDLFRLYGQSSGVTRLYSTPIQVVGPARIQVYVNPASSNTVTFTGSFDFYDQ